MTVTTDLLKVAGASLYYEVRGSGPVLLNIPGGPVDGGVFEDLAEELQDRYTVVLYDPRGHSRSKLDGAPQDVPVSVHADDAAALLESFGSEPAFVHGSSGGGTIGLELVTRHAGKVRTLVAHEPPVMELLPDRNRWHALFEDIVETYRTEGVFPAMGKFGAAVEEGGPKYEPGEPTPAMAAMFERMMAGNNDHFFAHEILPIGHYVPDIDALKAAPTRVVVGVGKASQEQGACRAGKALAAALGVEPTYFEGAHGGAGAEDAFAARLDEVLRGAS